MQVYADLVTLGLRMMEENKKGIILVPKFLRVKVAEELDRRKSLEII